MKLRQFVIATSIAIIFTSCYKKLYFGCLNDNDLIKREDSILSKEKNLIAAQEMAVQNQNKNLIEEYAFLKKENEYLRDFRADSIHLCLDVSSSKITTPPNALVVRDGLLWKNGSTLRVKFMNGDAFLQQKVKQFAVEWSKYANIKFVWTNSNAEIRIDFDNSNFSNSVIGTDALNIPQSEYTMRFGWFTDATSDFEFSRTVIHEFGHALGCVHEHQSPAAQIPWNKPYVYWLYAQQGWSQQKVDDNLFNHYSTSQTQFTAYDKTSIMQYSITAEEVTDPSFIVGWNSVLSQTDKDFIAFLYPKDKAVLDGVNVIFGMGDEDKNATTAMLIKVVLSTGQIVAMNEYCCYGEDQSFKLTENSVSNPIAVNVSCSNCVRVQKGIILHGTLIIDIKAGNGGSDKDKWHYHPKIQFHFSDGTVTSYTDWLINDQHGDRSTRSVESKNGTWAGAVGWAF